MKKKGIREFRAARACHNSLDVSYDESSCRSTGHKHTTCCCAGLSQSHQILFVGGFPALKSVGQGSLTLFETSFERRVHYPVNNSDQVVHIAKGPECCCVERNTGWPAFTA